MDPRFTKSTRKLHDALIVAKREDELARAKGVRINRRGGAFPKVDLSVESEAALETDVELEYGGDLVVRKLDSTIAAINGEEDVRTHAAYTTIKDRFRHALRRQARVPSLRARCIDTVASPRLERTQGLELLLVPNRIRRSVDPEIRKWVPAIDNPVQDMGLVIDTGRHRKSLDELA